MAMKRAIPAFIVAFLAFVCFVLVTVSAPFIKGLYLSHIQSASNGQLGLNLGVFGTCYPGRATVLGITVSHQACSSPHYPYTLDPAFFGWNNTASSSNYNPLSDKFMQNNVISLVEDVGKALILNPIAAALALVSFLPSLISICSSWRWTQMLAWVCLLLATLCGWIAFIVNIIFAALTRSRVKNNTNGAYVAKYGNAIWVSLAGAILMTIAMVMALFGACCCVKRKDTHDELLHEKRVHDVEADADSHIVKDAHTPEHHLEAPTPVEASEENTVLGYKEDVHGAPVAPVHPVDPVDGVHPVHPVAPVATEEKSHLHMPWKH